MEYYEKKNPKTWEGRESIKATGSVMGQERAEIDFEGENVARRRVDLEERAARDAIKFWPGDEGEFKKRGAHDAEIKTIKSYDVDDVRRIFSVAFIVEYRRKIKKLEERELRLVSSSRHRSEAEIRRAEHTEEGHLYEIEIIDKLYLEKPFRVEVLVKRHGDAELREVDNYA